MHEKKTGWRQWTLILIFCVDVHMGLTPLPRPHASTWAWPPLPLRVDVINGWPQSIWKNFISLMCSKVVWLLCLGWGSPFHSKYEVFSLYEMFFCFCWCYDAMLYFFKAGHELQEFASIIDFREREPDEIRHWTNFKAEHKISTESFYIWELRRFFSSAHLFLRQSYHQVTAQCAFAWNALHM